jgi:mRNA-degrading endonuclease toxin of MazEF toxin-antitoxin module
MRAAREPRVGDIYWLENCAPLHGDAAKTRPVVVVTAPEAEVAVGGILAVGCTSSAYPSDAEAIELPSHPQGKVRTGLRKRTWAVVPWALLIRKEQLMHHAGYISGALLDQLLKAFFERYQHEQQKRRANRN